MKRYKVKIEAAIDVPDYVAPGNGEQTPEDLTKALTKTALPASNGYAIVTFGKLTATLHVNYVSFEGKPCPHCGVQTATVEKIP